MKQLTINNETMKQLTMKDEQMDNRAKVGKHCSLPHCSLFIDSLFIIPLFIVSLFIGCCPVEPTSPTNALTNAVVPAGWTPIGEVETYDSETIYGLVNGQADFFFAYGFEQVTVRRYQNAVRVTVDIEVWQLTTPADAYGLFSAGIAGEPADLGNEADTDPGRRLAFWQDRYAVQVFARNPIPDDELWSFGEAVSAALPTGGEQPALVDRLPADGLVPRSGVFFHQELSIQDEIWLGGDNLLGLSPETDGVLARYEIDGAVAQLLLVDYPDAETASAGLAALQGGEVGGLVSAGSQGNTLGAVFGQVDQAAADELLNTALSK